METDGQHREVTLETLVEKDNNRRDKTASPTQVGTGEVYLTVVIPAYNEERRLPESLAKVLTWLDEQAYRSEVLVIDDGSDDSTIQTLQRTIEERQTRQNEEAGHCRLSVVANPHRGKAFTVRTGMLQGQGRYILFSDADFSTPIEDVSKLLPWLEQNYDVAIGSREGKGAQRYDEPFYRHLMGRVFNLLVKLVTFSPFEDTQCGFKAFRREVAHDLFSRVQLYGENSGPVQGAMVTGFDVEILFLARKRGYKVREVPVYWYHFNGSKVNPFKDSLRMIGDILKVRLNDWRGLYNSGQK